MTCVSGRDRGRTLLKSELPTEKNLTTKGKSDSQITSLLSVTVVLSFQNEGSSDHLWIFENSAVGCRSPRNSAPGVVELMVDSAAVTTCPPWFGNEFLADS